MIDEESSNPPPPFGRQAMEALRREHREHATLLYADSLSKLWVGNGAGTVAAVSALGVAASGRLVLHKWFLLCPAAFVLGLALLGLGTLVNLVGEAKWLNAHEESEGLLGLRVNFIHRSTYEVGLAWSNLCTLTAIGAAVAFLFGVVTGGAAVLQTLPI